MQPFSTISAAQIWVVSFLSCSERLPLIQGAAASSSSSVQRSPMPLREAAMAMGVGVDQAGMEQQAGRIDDGGAFGRREAGADLAR